jgi:hypothetical protein
LPLVAESEAAWLARIAAPVARCHRNTSRTPLASTCPGATFVAKLSKATQAPSPLSAALLLPTAVVAAPSARLTSVTVPVARSKRKMSGVPMVSVCPATRFVALLEKTT